MSMSPVPLLALREMLTVIIVVVMTVTDSWTPPAIRPQTDASAASSSRAALLAGHALGAAGRGLKWL